MWIIKKKNQMPFFGKLTFCEFHIFPCQANEIKLFQKKNQINLFSRKC